MKQIFDWLREAICEGSQCINERYYTTVVHSLSCVNEAEAKWETESATLETYRKELWKQQLREYGNKTKESECCEWKHKEYHTNCFCGHNEGYAEHDFVIGWNFCPYCGKPIKIAEVE